MATVVHLDGEAMRARKWGAVSNTAAVDRSWRSLDMGDRLRFL